METEMTFQLWSGRAIPPDPMNIPFAEGMEHRTIHDARTSDYKFLHGAAIINYKGTFFANWANSPRDENLARETLQGRRTKDPLGKWSEVEVIGPGFDAEERHSHGVYLEHKGELWTFAARFGIGAKGRRFDGLGAEAFVLNEKTDKWESRSRVIDNCWPYDQPVLMDNGSYITGGQSKDGLPVVAISHGDDLMTQWTSVLLPYPPKLEPRYAETTVWAEGKHVLAVIRGGEGVAWVSTSDDYGKLWSKAVPSNFPMPRSKAYLGKLSTGQLYMVSNFKNRDTLVISVGKPGEMTLSSMFRIRHGSSAPVPRFKGRAKAPQWSYPYGYEHDGKLYIVYSIGKEDCGLSVIPIKSLTVKNQNNKEKKQSMKKAQPWPTGDTAFAGLHSKAGHPMAVIDEKEYKQYINSFAVSQKGTWLISVTSGGVGYAKVYVKRSEDKGKTWSNRRITVYDPRQDETLERREDLDCEMGQLLPVPKPIGDMKIQRIYQFSIIRDIKKGARFGKLIYTVSEDDGKTWLGPDGTGSYWNIDSPVYDLVGHTWGWHLMAPPLVTSDDRMILPMNASTDPPSLRAIRCEPVYMSSTNIMTEQDPGKVTFTFNPPPPHGVHVPIEAKPKESHGMEAQVVELSDGRLFSPIRTGNGCIYFTISEDGGKTWGKAQPIRRDDDGPLLLNPNCANPITKLSDGSYALLHCNNDGNIYGVNDIFKHNVVRHPIYVSIGVENKPGSTQPIRWSEPRLMTTLEDYKPKHRDGWNDLTYGLLHEQDGKFYHFYNAKWDRIQVNEINPLLFLPPDKTPMGREGDSKTLPVAAKTARASLDWRDADRTCYGKVDESGPGQHFNDNARIVIANDGTWICAWSTGTHEAGAGMHIVYSLSHDQGRTWSTSKPIEPSIKNTTSAYGYLFKSPVNGRIFSIYRFHDHEKVMKEMRQLGQKPPNTGGHFRDTTGQIAFRYSDDHGKTWSDRHIIPTRRTLADNTEGPMCGWFYGIGPVVIDDHVWFSGNKYKATITTGGDANSSKTSADTWETWFWKSPNMHTESDPAKFIWENKPNGDRGIVPDEGVRYWVEASLVALEDPGNLYCVARNRYTGVLGQSFSTDGGNTWQTPPGAAQYWDGSGDLNNPKAGPMLKQLSDGTYLLTFYNDRARPDNEVPWDKLFDRNPLWGAVGWPDGNVLKFSQPEILLYNDENVKTSAEGNRSSIYHPFLFEVNGKVFTVFSNKKTDVQIAEIPWSLINAMKQQRTAKTVAKDGLVLSLSQEEIAAKPEISLTDHNYRFGDLSKNGAFAMDFWLELTEDTPNATILDSRNEKNHNDISKDSHV